MKKTINVAIGGCSFTIDEDAYKTLEDYLDRFQGALDQNISNKDVMDELEGRIADLLKERLRGREVVDMTMRATLRKITRNTITAEPTEKDLQESCSETLTAKRSEEYAQDWRFSSEST